MKKLKVKGIRHIGIEVRDMNKMLKFYKGLGLKVIWDKIEQPEEWDCKIHTIKLECPDGTIIELCEGHKSDIHFALNVTDTDKKVTWLRDPENNLLELVND